MAHPPYRNTALGKTLRDSLDELAKKQKINRLLAKKVLLKFDKTAPASLFPRINNHVSFQGQLRSFRYNEDEWTFYLREVEFKELMYEVAVQKLKIVAAKDKQEACMDAEHADAEGSTKDAAPPSP